MPISKNIKLLREKFNLSQKDLATIAGVSNKAVSTWERGLKEPRMGAIQKLADHFGLKKSNLIEDGGMDDIVLSAPASEALSVKENKLIQKYRSLPPKGQKTVDLVCDSFAAVPDLAEAVPKYAALDAVDRGKVLERMQQLADDDKYRPVVKGGRTG